MLDNYLLFVPLLIFPIILLFVFVGCQYAFPLDELIPLSILIRFHPARGEKFIPVVEIHQNGETFPTLREEPTSLPNGDSQFKLYNSEFTDYSHSGGCTITCSIYLNEIFGSPVIGPISCEFQFNRANNTSVFVIDSSNNVIGCLPEV